MQRPQQHLSSYTQWMMRRWTWLLSQHRCVCVLSFVQIFITKRLVSLSTPLQSFLYAYLLCSIVLLYKTAYGLTNVKKESLVTPVVPFFPGQVDMYMRRLRERSRRKRVVRDFQIVPHFFKKEKEKAQVPPKKKSKDDRQVGWQCIVIVQWWSRCMCQLCCIVFGKRKLNCSVTLLSVGLSFQRQCGGKVKSRQSVPDSE